MKGIKTYPGTVFYSPKNECLAEYTLRLTYLKEEKTFNELQKRLYSAFRDIPQYSRDFIKDQTFVNNLEVSLH